MSTAKPWNNGFSAGGVDVSSPQVRTAETSQIDDGVLPHTPGTWGPSPERPVDRLRLLFVICSSLFALSIPSFDLAFHNNKIVIAIGFAIPIFGLWMDSRTLKKKAKPLQAIAARQRSRGWAAVDLEIKLDGCTLGSDSGILILKDAFLRYEGVRTDFGISARDVILNFKPQSMSGPMRSIVRLQREGKTYDLEFITAQNFDADKAIDVFATLQRWTQAPTSYAPETLPPRMIQRDLIVKDDHLRAPVLVVVGAIGAAMATLAVSRRLHEPWRAAVESTFVVSSSVAVVFAMVTIAIHLRVASRQRQILGSSVGER